MDRPDDSRRQEQIETERKLLAALCQGTLDEHTRAVIRRRLEAHSFVERDFEVIYRALAAMPATDPGDTREELARAVTRLGFPDMEFDALFSAAPAAPSEIANLLQRL